MSKKLKKGGVARYVIDPLSQNVTFTVPPGIEVTRIFAECKSTLTGTPKMIISTASGTIPVQRFTVTSVNSATTGDITVDTITVSLGSGDIDTVGHVADAIAAADLSSKNWIVTDNGATVTLTGFVPKAVTSAITVALSTATNITFSDVTVVTAGVVGSLFLSSSTLPKTIGQVSELTSSIQSTYKVNSTQSVNSVVFSPSVSNAVAGTVIVCGVPIALASGNVDTAAHFITKVASALVPGYTMVDGTTTLTISANSNTQGLGLPTMVLGTATGITWTQVNTYANKTYYITTGSPAIAAATKLYIITQKVN